MKQVKIHPGVVLVSVCEEHILVATREAREKVPYVQQINSAAAFYWEQLQNGLEPQDIARQAASKYHISGRQAAGAVIDFLKKLHQRGYVVIEDVEDI